MFFKRNVRFAFLATLFFFIVMVSAAMLPEAASAADKPIALKFAYWMPTKHTLHRVFEGYAKEVEALTGGRVKITLYPGQGDAHKIISFQEQRECQYKLEADGFTIDRVGERGVPIPISRHI